MDLQRLQYKRRTLENAALDQDNELDQELDIQIQKEKFDIYKLQKHAEIKQALVYGDKYCKDFKSAFFLLFLFFFILL